jgi:DNA polymerase-4
MAKILHIDLDAFYPSVEVLDEPELAGRPVIVGGLGPRGVVASASYEARRHGVHSAMPMSRARLLCPDGVYRSPRFRRYREMSRVVFSIYRRWTDAVETLALDEAFLDVTANPETGLEIARSIKEQIATRTGLSASAGVSFNKFLAKLASDHDKPDGLTEIAPGSERRFLDPLPVDRIWGVGPATERRLHALGVRTVGDAARLDQTRLVGALGRQGRRIAELARGIDPRPVHAPGPPKSVSAEVTFDRDIDSWREAREHLHRFAERIEAGLSRHGLRARTVVLKVRYSDFRTVTRSSTIDEPVSSAPRILDVARELARRAPIDPRRRARLVGLGASNLTDATAPPAPTHARPRQLDLFSRQKDATP